MWVALVLVAGIIGVGLASWAGIPYGLVAWLADLAASWMLLGVLLAAYAAVRAKLQWRVRGGLVLLSLVLAGVFASPPLGDAGEGARLKVMSANIHLDTTDLAPLKRWVDAQAPDIVLLQEVSPLAAEALATWAEWPHRVVIPDSTPFGIAVLSRLPMRAQPVPEDPAQTPVIRVVLRHAEGDVAVSAVHPMPPISAEYHKLRDALLVRESAWLKSEGGGVLAGDLNATPWSSALHRAAEAGLRRAGTWEPTWPGYPFVGIAVDHVLATGAWCATDFTVGPRVGSDHLPVVATLRRCAG